MDFTAITGAVDLGALALGLIALGALKIVPNAAKWGANKLASMFR